MAQVRYQPNDIFDQVEGRSSCLCLCSYMPTFHALSNHFGSDTRRICPDPYGRSPQTLFIIWCMACRFWCCFCRLGACDIAIDRRQSESQQFERRPDSFRYGSIRSRHISFETIIGDFVGKIDRFGYGPQSPTLPVRRWAILLRDCVPPPRPKALYLTDMEPWPLRP